MAKVTIPVKSVTANFNKDGDISALEMKLAEHNFDVILAAAEMAAKTPLAHFLGGLDTSPLKDLIDDLRRIFGIIRGSGDKLKKETLNKYDCLCPLTVFLQIIAKGLNTLNVKTKGNPEWGTITPLHKVLDGLDAELQSLNQTRAKAKRKSKQPKEDDAHYFPGISQCIMCHYDDGEYTITSTAARYDALIGVRDWARQVRDVYLQKLENELDENRVRKINALLQYSEDLRQHLKKPDDKPNPFEDPRNQERIEGIGASFGPNGKVGIWFINQFLLLS
jgi:hypothetical protein